MNRTPPSEGYPLGRRAPLGVGDLPSPEEVFEVPRLGRKEILTCAVGPSLIALGVAIGGGEWILGPLAIGGGSFEGLFLAVLISALLQTVFNIEIARYVVATGEVPVLGFGRVPPGYVFWVPVALGVLYLGFIFGGTFAVAGQGLYPLFAGEVAGEDDIEVVRLLAIAVLAAAMVLALFARKISALLERFNLWAISAALLTLIVLDVALVPADVWGEGLLDFVTPALPAEGTSATAVGALVGYTALASGVNWFVMSHYRDKGYGMGTRVGFLAGGRGPRREVLGTGLTFPDTERNRVQWRRWLRLVRIDMWTVFFPAALMGMFLPSILVAHLARTSGREPTDANMPTFAADVLGSEHGRALFYVVVVMGIVILVKTAVNVFEALVRNVVDAVNGSESSFGARVRRDPRRFYFPYMLGYLVVAGIMLHLDVPARLLQIAANMATFGMLIFPFLVIWLNRRLPAPARPSWIAEVLLLACVVFFGFFFLNFLTEQISGDPLVTF